MQRRAFLAAACMTGCTTASMTGCASLDTPDLPPAPGASAAAGLLPWRTLTGGYLTPILPAPGAPPALGSGMFVRWMSPRALALRGSDLLVADAGTGRLWRADTVSSNLTGVAGAPVGPGTALALGPDGSAWVLDPGSGQVLRFGRDGRLLQTHRAGVTLPAPVALALADGGATLLLADGLGAQWVEQRGPAGVLRPVLPRMPGAAAGEARIGGVDGLAVTPDAVWVLDRAAGLVHLVTRDGQVRRSLGRGELKRPLAVAVDRVGRAYVLDAHDDAVCQFGTDGVLRRWPPRELGVTRCAAIAVDGLMLALADDLGGRVVLHRLAEGDAS